MASLRWVSGHGDDRTNNWHLVIKAGMQCISSPIQLYLYRFPQHPYMSKHRQTVQKNRLPQHIIIPVHKNENMDSLIFDTSYYETLEVIDRKMFIEMWMLLNQKRFSMLIEMVFLPTL